MDMTVEIVEVDALIVGAGFAGVYQLKRLREEGFNVKIVEGGSNYGGVWYWNRYPGARVDIPIPHYEFSDPDLWMNWHWTQRFPGSAELRAYFDYVAERWDLRRDTLFNTWVESASWDDTEGRWTVRMRGDSVFKCQFFLPNTGVASKRFIPDLKGTDSFKGTWIHPSNWPKEGLDMASKKVAIIGTGSTAVQIVQALAPVASELVIFQRTPNLAIPLKQVSYKDTDLQSMPRDQYKALYEGRLKSFGGLDYNFLPVGTFEHDEEQRRATYQELWDQGDMHFWIGTYHDMLFDERANTEAYSFWRDKVRSRLQVDDELKEKLAPMKKPHAFGCKRVSLENGYFECFNRPNVHLVDINETPLIEVTPDGIQTSDREWKVDHIVCATGFDAVTGGILSLNISGRNGEKLRDKWKSGVKTYMGLCVADFPNMFFTYGPQAPTSLCNGPSCAELQGEWIVSLLKYMRAKDLKVINADAKREEEWAEGVWTIANMSLLPSTKSWYMGDNVPGKTREPLIYLGGVPTYHKKIHECAEKGYEGFHLS